MSLLTRLQASVPFLGRRAPSLPRQDMLGLRPVRNPAITWDVPQEDDEDPIEGPSKIVLTVPQRRDPLMRALMRWLQVSGSKKIELDEFGGQVWTRCDGQTTVEQLVRYTCTEYKLNRRQSEVSVVAFMRMLSQRRLIGFAVEKERNDGSSDAAPRARGRGQKRARGARRRN